MNSESGGSLGVMELYNADDQLINRAERLAFADSHAGQLDENNVHELFGMTVLLIPGNLYTTNVQDIEFVLHLSCGCLCKLCDGNALTDDAGGGDLAASDGGAVASGVGKFGDQTMAA